MQKLTYKRDTTFPLKIKVYDFGKPARFTTGQFDIFVKSMIPTSDQIQINISNKKFLIGQETSLVTKCEISKSARISPTLISNPPELARGFKISESCELSVTNYNFIRNGSLTITAVSGNEQSKGWLHIFYSRTPSFLCDDTFFRFIQIFDAQNSEERIRYCRRYKKSMR